MAIWFNACAGKNNVGIINSAGAFYRDDMILISYIILISCIISSGITT